MTKRVKVTEFNVDAIVMVKLSFSVKVPTHPICELPDRAQAHAMGIAEKVPLKFIVPDETKLAHMDMREVMKTR